MTFGQAIQAVFRQYAEFRGVARRSEFWWWTLFTVLVSAALNLLPLPWAWPLWAMGGDSTVAAGSRLAALWGIAVLLPSLAVLVRRLRDAGYAWGHVFWLLAPIVGVIILAILCSQPSRRIVPASPADAGPTPARPGP